MICGLAAFTSWGLFPAYFKALRSVPPVEVLAHRAIWSSFFLLALLWLRSGAGQLGMMLRDRSRLRPLALSAMLLAANWLIFLWAITNNHVLQSSLGYFLNPLMNILLGTVFLRERLRGRQSTAIALAAGGVLYQAVRCGEWPWIALSLAISFSLYGFVRKQARVEAIAGNTLETMLMAPLAIGYLVWAERAGDALFLQGNARIDLLLIASGVITAIPLIWFVTATRLLPYSTVGVIQFIVPTGQFLLAVLAFREPFTIHHLVSFSLVWAGIALFLWEARRTRSIARASHTQPIVAGTTSPG
jgi:chloramphenicol-sensitive protein RarD